MAAGPVAFVAGGGQADHTATLMRTVDILVTALFSPVAVAAIGLADLYARFPLGVGLGMGAAR